MATGASTAELAIILIDARKGVLPQTRRHSFLVHLLGIRHVLVAVNKMDLVSYDQAVFDGIVADYRRLAAEIGIADFAAIPVAAKPGDNVAARSAAMPWYEGPALLDHLETVPIEAATNGIAPFRMPVQWVNRPDQEFRGYAGTVASGRVRIGDAVAVLPSGRTTEIARIVTADGDLNEAVAGQAVTLTFADALDCSRGDLISAAGATPVADAVDASLVWVGEVPLVPHRPYWLKIGAQTVSAEVTVDAVVAVNGSGSRASRELVLNDIGHVSVALDRSLAATTYADNRALGGFILIDKASNATVAAGMIRGFRSGRVADRHAERIFWAGDEAGAERLQERFGAHGRPSFVLTETTLREELDDGFVPEDAASVTRRAAGVARLMAAAGVTVIVAISPAAGLEVPGSLSGPDTGEGASDEDWVI
jgi:bifunctional enzyme CysN/CysC